MHGFQLWANLPSSLKMSAPRGPDSVIRRCRLHACRDSRKPVEASDKKRPPRYVTPRALALPQVCSSAGEHISLRRLKVFSSCGKGPGIGLLSCKCSILHSQTSGLWRTLRRVRCTNEHREHLRLVRTSNAYAAEHTDEPRQRKMWLQLAEQREAAALQAHRTGSKAAE
jgi:hypothetical protein